MSAALEKATTSAAMYGVFRHERHGLADEEARRRMRLLVPHIRRAVLIAKVIDLKQAEAAMLAQTLDGLRAAMFLVDASGRVAADPTAALSDPRRRRRSACHGRRPAGLGPKRN